LLSFHHETTRRSINKLIINRIMLFGSLTPAFAFVVSSPSV